MDGWSSIRWTNPVDDEDDSTRVNGSIHYASDTPCSHAHTLGARGMSYRGMDSTYAATLAIVRRVFENCR